MAKIEVHGVIYKKYDARTVGKKKPFTKREFIVEERSESPYGNMVNFLKFLLTGRDTAYIDNFDIGDRVVVVANVRGSKWKPPDKKETVFFTELRVIEIHYDDIDRSEEKQEEEDVFTSDKELDELPF